MNDRNEAVKERQLTGVIVGASFEDGVERPTSCGLEDCECPDHDSPPLPAGTYIKVLLDDEDAPVGKWRVTVTPDEQE